MDSAALQEQWNRVCERLKERDDSDASRISAFFSKLQPQAMSDGFLMITADNDFIRHYVETHYLIPIQDTLEELYGNPYTVVVEVYPHEALQHETATVTPSTPSVSTPPLPDEASYKLHQEASATPPVSAPSTTSTSVESTFSRRTPSSTHALASNAEAFTFETFVIGESNQMAYSMAQSVAERPGVNQPLNPLFIYGRSGLGKTHLLRAIQNYLYETRPELKVLYIDSMELLSEYMDASSAHDKEKSSFKNFKARYEEADVLLVDDIQHLQGKTQTLTMFFQIFNNLISWGKQIVLSADRAPKNIDIDERYSSRFSSGGIIDIQPPELETKLSIIKLFIDEYARTEGRPGFSIPQEISNYIAEISSSNIRELKSAITKVIYHMTYFNEETIDLETVQKLLQNHFPTGPSRNITVEDVQKEVEKFYKVNHSDLIGPKRSRDITFPRHVGIYLCRQLLDYPFTYIAKKFNRDHTTAMHSVTKVEEQLKVSREFQEELDMLKRIIREG